MRLGLRIVEVEVDVTPSGVAFDLITGKVMDDIMECSR